MKRLIKKAGEYWDPQLPGARSSEGEFAVIQNKQVLICEDNGSVLRTINFFQLGLTDKSTEDQIQSAVIGALTFYLSSHRD